MAPDTARLGNFRGQATKANGMTAVEQSSRVNFHPTTSAVRVKNLRDFLRLDRVLFHLQSIMPEDFYSK
jgi:hypothetical protein